MIQFFCIFQANRQPRIPALLQFPINKPHGLVTLGTSSDTPFSGRSTGLFQKRDIILLADGLAYGPEPVTFFLSVHDA